jgi:hypothetical protein
MTAFRTAGLTATTLVLIAQLGLHAGGLQFVDQTASRFPSPNPTEWTNQVTAGDIDNDGDIDLIFANGGNFASAGTPEKARIYINDGSGTFTDETDARSGGHAGLHRGVELGDCDRDTDLDILLAQDFDRLPELLLNDGNGNFSAEGDTRLPPITLSSSRGQFGDVDNDGDLDIFFTTGTTSRFTCGQYRLYLNDGSCHYSDATSTHIPTDDGCNNMDCIFGDIDGDFDLDIRTASTGNDNSRLYVNDGTGVFSLAATPPDSSCYSYDFGDINGNGDLDLLGANGFNGNNGEMLMENDGLGGYTDVSGQISPNPNEDDNDSKFVDYDNDGDLDLLIARLGSGGEKLYRNDGDGNFAQVSGVVQVINDSSLDVVVADLTGDGAYDFVTGQGESGSFENRIYVNSGPADSLPPRIVSTERLSTPPGLAPAVVRAAILDDMSSDRNFFDQGILLGYSVDGGLNQTATMVHSGGQIYRGSIPEQAAGATVEYWVTARDWNSNVATSATSSYVVPDCSGLGDCSGHGICIGENSCDCLPPWLGLDCSEVAPAPAGEVPDGDRVSGTPLRMQIVFGNALRLTWSRSCYFADTDFAVYRGQIGNFTSHEPVTCSSGGQTSLIFGPPPEDSYFLVVPTNPNREGSYGRDSTGAERPQASDACLPPGIQSCL